MRLWRIISLANWKLINSFNYLCANSLFLFSVFAVMSDPTSDVEEIIVMEHHDPEKALADLPLSMETVLQLSVEQLREKLQEFGIDPKGRPKPSCN